MDNILVLGGTGFVGHVLCEKLTEWLGSGGRIVVPSRHPQRAKDLITLPPVQVVRASVHDDAELTQLVRGHDAVINLVAILHGSERDFERVHVELPRRLATACAVAGVKRVLHVSALGAAESAPSMYQRSKARGEAELRQVPLDLTVFRPSVIFGEHDRFINLFASLQRVFPVMPLARADAKLQPVWVDDVACAIVRSLDERSTIGQTVECAGPQVHSLRDLVTLAGRWSGHERPVIGMPDAFGTLQALMLELLPGDPLMSRDNLASLKVDNVASGEGLALAALGIQPRAIESVMPSLLGRRSGPARLEPWRALARRG